MCNFDPAIGIEFGISPSAGDILYMFSVPRMSHIPKWCGGLEAACELELVSVSESESESDTLLNCNWKSDSLGGIGIRIEM